MNAALAPTRRDLVWFIIVPLTLAGCVAMVQHAGQQQRLHRLWSSPVPPPSTPR